MRKLSLEECKALSANILYRVDSLCRNNGLVYMVLYGTLLGAIRHKGFIPWDDDIDIVMKRQDYNKLAQLINKDEFLRFIRIEDNPDTIYPHGKIIDTRTEMYIHRYRHVEGYGLGIDVFPMDYMSNNKRVRSRSIKHALLLRKLIEHSANTVVSKNSFGLRQMAKYVAFGLTRLCDTRKLILKLDRLNQNNPESDYIGVAWDAGLPVEKLFYPIDLEFEGFKVMAPKDPDYCLKMKFGDYMKLPPEEERVPKHFYDCYLKDEYEDMLKPLFNQERI